MSRYRKTMSEAMIEVSALIDEGRMKDIYTMDQEGKSAAQIAKVLKLPVPLYLLAGFSTLTKK